MNLSDDKKQKSINSVEVLKQRQDNEDLDIIYKVINENAKAWEDLAK